MTKSFHITGLSLRFCAQLLEYVLPLPIDPNRFSPELTDPLTLSLAIVDMIRSDWLDQFDRAIPMELLPALRRQLIDVEALPLPQRLRMVAALLDQRHSPEDNLLREWLVLGVLTGAITNLEQLMGIKLP